MMLNVNVEEKYSLYDRARRYYEETEQDLGFGMPANLSKSATGEKN